VKKVCIICGKEFEGKTDAKYCSDECRKQGEEIHKRLYNIKRKHERRWVGWYERHKREVSERRKEYYYNVQKKNDETLSLRKAMRRDGEGKKIPEIQDYLEELHKAVRFLDGEDIILNDIGLRIVNFLDSCRRAWITVVPRENQHIDRVLNFIEAENLSEQERDTVIEFLQNHEKKLTKDFCLTIT
jgi:predicted nucleic acid-binding Zn ribbon protein